MKYFLYSLAFIFVLSCQKDTETKELKTEKIEVTDRPPSKWGFLTNGIFHYTYVDHVKEKVPVEEYKGKWIDLNNDYSYTWGFYDKVHGKGHWKYDNNNDLLGLIPETAEYKRSEWKVKNGEDFVVMAGTTRFEDNAIQMKWDRYDEKPTKE